MIYSCGTHCFWAWIESLSLNAAAATAKMMDGPRGRRPSAAAAAAFVMFATHQGSPIGISGTWAGEVREV